jgi:hypothetical protein
LPAGPSCTAGCGTLTASQLAAFDDHPHELAGLQLAVGIGEFGAHVEGAGLRVRLVVAEVEFARGVDARAVGEHQTDALPALLEGAFGKLFLQCQPSVLADRKTRIDGGDLRQRGERRAAGAHQRTFHLQRPSHHAGKRRANVGVAQIDARIGKIRLGRAHASLGDGERSLRDIECARTDKALRRERAVAVQFQLRFRQQRLAVGELGAGCTHLRGQARAIEFEQQRTGLHRRPLLEMAALDDGGDARTDLHLTRGFQPADIFEADRHRLRDDRFHRHLCRRRPTPGLRRLLLPARGEQHPQTQSNYP